VEIPDTSAVSAEIGKRFGPFDLALLPIGAYEPRELLKPVHMNPADAVQAFLDLRGKTDACHSLGDV